MVKAKTYKSILKVASSNLIYLLSSILVGFLLPKIIGVTNYGYYKTFTLYATYIGLFQIGIVDGIYLKYGGKTYDELDKSTFNFYSKFLFCLELLFSAILLVIAILFLESDIRFIFVCMSIYLLFYNISNYYKFISQITSRFNEYSIRTIIKSILTTILIISLFLVYYFTSNILSYKVYLVCFISIEGLLMLWYLHTYRELSFRKANTNINKKKEIISLVKIGVPLLVANLCSTLLLTVDRQFVNIFFELEEYSIYAFAYNMLSLITIVATAISTVLYPTIKSSNGDSGENYKSLTTAILLFAFCCLVAYFPLCIFVDYFLPSYTYSLIIFRIILPGVAMSTVITSVIHNYFKKIEKNLFFLGICILMLILSIGFNFLAYYFFGTMEAISWASVIVTFIWYFMGELYLKKKFMIRTLSNNLYMIVMTLTFYIVTLISNIFISLIIYVILLLIISFVFNCKTILKFLKKGG